MCLCVYVYIVRKLEQTNSGSNRMKQIFRNLKNDNKNEAIKYEIYVETQCGKKPWLVTSTTNPLYEKGEYKIITITIGDLTQQQKYNPSCNLSQNSLPLNVFGD